MSETSSLQSYGATVRGAASRPGSRPRGFTLIELLVTMSVAGVLVGIALPAFSGYVQNARLTTETDSLLYALNLARSEAVKTDATVQVCASMDGATCSGTWEDGWIVECPAACPPGLGPTPALLLVAPAVRTGNTINEEVSGATAVSYSSTGQTGGGSLEFVLCDRRGPSAGRELEVNSIGEVTSSSTPGQTVSGVALGGC
jgi:type IV fimbrial biogenesis protein FimT